MQLNNEGFKFERYFISLLKNSSSTLFNKTIYFYVLNSISLSINYLL